MLKKMTAAAVVTCTLALGALPAGTLAGNAEDLAGNGSGFTVANEDAYPIAPGVVHTDRTLIGNGTMQSLRIMEIDPKNPHIELMAYSSHGKVAGQETVGNMIREAESTGKRVVGGVNGDFFSVVGIPSGLQISGGEVVSSPGTVKTLMMVMRDGSVRLEDSITMTAAVTADDGSALGIDMINRTRVPGHANHLFLYTPRFGDSTRTPKGGVEVVVKAVNPKAALKAGVPLIGKVESVVDAFDTPIQADKFILSASGAKADWVRTHLDVGQNVRVDVSFDKDVNKAREVISGNSTYKYVLLKDGEIPDLILDPTNKLMTDPNPRTILATKQGKLYIFSVDGRSPGYSDGLSLVDAARYLQSLGMEQAINIDGGGSTTYYARQPGEEHPRLLNRPSDQHERPVGNALLVVSTAPEASLKQIVLKPDSPIRIAAGSRIRLTAKGMDLFYNPLTVSPDAVSWAAEGGIGTIGAAGELTAGDGSATGKVVASIGGLKQFADVVVTDRIARLELTPEDFVVETDREVAFQADAYDEQGERVLISPERLNWLVDGEIGTFAEPGVLHTADKEARGKVVARYGELTAEAFVHVGKSPVLEGFESIETVRPREIRTVPGSVKLSLTSAPEPVHDGKHALRMAYDFTGMPDTSGAYVEFLNERGELGRTVEGRPHRIGLWVYGDALYHQLKLGVTDGAGNKPYWNMTAVGGVNWTGWRYVYADVPKNTVFPLQVRNVLLAESAASNKNAGVLYFDRLSAEYTDEAAGAP